MTRGAIAFAVAALLSLPAGGQEEETKLSFNFKEASLDAVLQYVSSRTGWIFVQEKKVSTTITAVSDSDVPVAKCLDFLNSALRPAGAVIPNPYSPALPKPGQVLKVQDTDEAKRRNIEIYTGLDPDLIPVTDQMRTQILPLKAVNVVEVNKELKAIIEAAVGESGMAISTYSNSIVLTGRAEAINRVARILRVLDVSTSAELKIEVFILKNADATETAKTLNEVFKKETMQAQTGQQNPISNFFSMMRGGGEGRGGSGSSGGPQPRALAHEMVRITAEPRTNAVIVSATADNLVVITKLISKLDDKSAVAMKLKAYPLRYADATTAAKLIGDVFAEKSAGGTGRSGGQGGRNPFMEMMQRGSQGGGSSDGSSSASKEVRAVAEVRTNSVLVAASEQNLTLVDGIVLEIDREVNDILEVKIYRLKNADPVQMTTILQALFRPQVSATQSAGRTTTSGGGGSRTPQFGGGNQGASSSSTLLPRQEVEITSDTRTRAIIVKASREYITIMDAVVKELDQDPTESVGTYVIPLKNADAATLALTLQNLLRGTSGSSSSYLNNSNRGMGTGGQLNQSTERRGLDYGTGSGSGSSNRGSGRRNLGPLQQEPPPLQDPLAAQEEDLRRGIEGQVDVQADPNTNSLVVRTSPRNFQSIQGMLQQLDRMRPQVLIKVLIADVTLDERTQFGVEGFWENRMKVPGGDKATHRSTTDFPLGTQGFTQLITSDEFQASLNLFAQEGKLRILATPRILVLDNQTASINVGKRVPIITNTTQNALGNTINTVAYENVGILLDVTPQINPDGLVTMTVAPEVSDVASEAESVQIAPGANSPTFNVNAAETRVAVRNGTTVVIGGLIREASDDTVQKIPLLGDIPLIGHLFSNTIRRKVKRELLIFLTPYVAYTTADLDEITGLEKAKLRLLDPRDIQAESDRWLDEARR